jgi:DNA-binding protein Fis
VEHQPFISERALHQVMQALEGKKRMLAGNPQIQLGVALQALDNGYSLSEIVEQATAQVEAYILARILDLANGSKTRAARMLRIDYKTLYRKLYKYTIKA